MILYVLLPYCEPRIQSRKLPHPLDVPSYHWINVPILFFYDSLVNNSFNFDERLSTVISVNGNWRALRDMTVNRDTLNNKHALRKKKTRRFDICWRILHRRDSIKVKMYRRNSIIKININKKIPNVKMLFC